MVPDMGKREAPEKEEGITAALPKDLSRIDELSGKLSMQFVEDKLMHSVLENDRETIDTGKLITESLNQGFGALTPDLVFEKLVKNYSLAKRLMGDSLIRLLSGYDAGYVEKNLRIPEFRKELRRQVESRLETMRSEKLLTKDGSITEKGTELASLILYVDELDHLRPKGFSGESVSRELHAYGDKDTQRNYRTGDRYRSIGVRDTIKRAIRRGHVKVIREDIVAYDKRKKGAISIIYCLDCSASMKGKKLDQAKRAGIALAYHTINKKDAVGLVVFSSKVKHSLAPTLSFTQVLKDIAAVRPASQTNIVLAVKKAVELLADEKGTKHILLLTDALPTAGRKPETETLEAVDMAKNSGITLSLIGIGLDDAGTKLAERIAEKGGGRLYIVKKLEELDALVLEDYYSL